MLESKSDWIVENCLKQPTPDALESFNFKIEEWLYKQKQNTALFICEEEGNDLQCLISHWIKDLNRDIVIPFFVEHENQNYYYAIYYVLTRLKSIFNITQKVEIEGEKLKQFFSYWLEFYSRELQNQVFSDAKSVYKRGIDKFRDSSGEVRASYWLPKVLPDNIKLIVSGRSDSKAHDYYCNQGSAVITIDAGREEYLERLISTNQQLYKIYTKLPTKLQEQTFFSRCFEMILVPHNEDFQDVLKEINTNIDCTIQNKVAIKSDIDFYNLLIRSFLKYYPEANYTSILSLLTFVFKGISIDEIMAICNCDKEQVSIVYQFFKVFLMEKDSVYWIFSLTFKGALSAHLPQNKVLYHQFLTIMEHSQNSVRKLEELIYQYTKTKRYFKLKEVLINIESFLLLCNPNHKFELCHLWETLEQNGYDLVMEYNKAVENFQALYKPTHEGLFFIMLQICRFLREFGNFENDHTPTYKHPELRGQSIEFDEVGLYGELKQLAMIARKKTKQLNEDYFPQQVSIEALNMDVKANRDYLVTYYMNQFDQALVQEYVNTKQEHILEKIITNTRNPQHYYYKRWIWVQYPWLALAQKNNYSKLMEFYSKDHIPMSDEMQISQKAIKLAQIAKSTKQINNCIPKFQVASKLPSINSSIRLRQYSPLETSRNTNIQKTRAESEHTRTERSLKPIALPSVHKFQYQKKLDQITYQNQVLRNRLREYNTIRQNMYPEEIGCETQRTLEVTKQLSEEFKKQQEHLQVVQQEMKRINVVWKLCQQNQDYNEDRAQQLVRHSKNLDRLISEQTQEIRDCSDKLVTLKHKQKIESKRVLVEKKQIVQQGSSRMTYLQNIPPSPGMVSNIDNSYFLDAQKRQQRYSATPNKIATDANEIKLKFVKLKSLKNDMLTSAISDTHTQDLVQQLSDLGIDNPYKNEKWIQFCDKIIKNQELLLEIQNRQQKLQDLKNQKIEINIFSKILAKSEKPLKYNEGIHYSSYECENVMRQNDHKTMHLKELRQHQAVIKFYNNNLYNLIKSVQKVESHDITYLGNVLQKMT